jgi:bifunctional UDP-N-acetylglucosamine pyrophosphorylase / glucosamine-1-phosphate N-acetyltransferase
MSKTKNAPAPVTLLILAAGLGKRMKSPLPKVLHEVCGEPMLVALLRSVAEAIPEANVGIIVGHGREEVERVVREALTSVSLLSKLQVEFLLQAKQLGTGHAVREAMDTAWGRSRTFAKAPILVLPGDSPQIPPALIEAMGAPLEKGTAVRVLSCRLPEPKGYGRIVRVAGKAQGSVLRIVEEKDANLKERAIQEVATSIYTFDGAFLSSYLPRLKNKNAQGEYYLTDLVALAAKAKKKIKSLVWANSDDVRGVNDLWELSIVERALQLRIIERHARNGVRFLDPWSVAIEAGVVLGSNVRIHRGVVLRGATTIGDRVDIGSNTVLRSTRVGDEVVFKAGCYSENSVVEAGAKVGPYAHLRPESHVGRDSKIGNFVELKKAVIGEKTSIAHLSYVGDAKIGNRVNIGCGFITCNFDGRVKNGSRKHVTVIEDDCFIGSDVQMVAPIRIGKGAYVASGSTITKDVESDALAIARARQETRPGYAKRLREASEK